ncbi:MAG: hypothetical protein ABIP48_19135 [Planctomycetota bacterium]
MKRARRSGFSLLEVIMAAAILLGSLVVLGQLATVGRMHAHDADELTTAQVLSQSKLNEILAGVELLRSVEDQALLEAPGWVYSVEVESLDRLGLASLRVTVSEDLSELDEDGEQRPPKRFTLTRWVRDPEQQARSGPDSDSLLSVPAGRSFSGDEFP